MQLNYFGAIRLMMGLLPHMRERGSGHIVNVSSIGVQTNPPRFSAYVASKAALDAWTRVVSSEVVGDGITFTTIHMPLVRTPMIAPTKMYDSFPTITPDEAGDLVCEALRAKPKQINTRLGTFGEVAYALAPKAVDQVLHMAYKVFPDSAAAQGAEGRQREGLDGAGGDGQPHEGRALVARVDASGASIANGTRPESQAVLAPPSWEKAAVSRTHPRTCVAPGPSVARIEKHDLPEDAVVMALVGDLDDPQSATAAVEGDSGAVERRPPSGPAGAVVAACAHARVEGERMRGPIEARLDGGTLSRATVPLGELEPVGVGRVARRPLDDEHQQPNREQPEKDAEHP